MDNLVSGNVTLRNSLDSTPSMIEKAATAVAQAEAHVGALEISYNEINRCVSDLSGTALWVVWSSGRTQDC